MAELQRITTEYVDAEDRIRLNGELGSGHAPVVLWLTQRLLQRLLPVLLKGLQRPEAGADLAYADMLHGFAQQAAQANLLPEPPVQAAQHSAAWLVLSVDIAQSAESVCLTFKAADGRQASLTLAETPLRQWLGIVYHACLKAGWPLQVWPQWLQESRQPAVQPVVVLH
ncbi:MAG: hypothetical protein A3E79_03520 [Burkholderiales bacterium RIFCSPHIGHO2_12_FULL_61_11]|nr:MAG: hypothetical protein A3E79_03520 [Burkholderiales bacterium RIFCSPHIGHO2_12_FULL_61_11]